MRSILTGLSNLFQLTKQEKTVAIFLVLSLAVGNTVLFLKRRRADFATDLVISEQLTLQQLSRKGDSLAAGGREYLMIDINAADEAELQLLPGIGPATARRILHYRDSLGPFVAPEELLKVKGIGEAKYRSLKECVFVECSEVH